MGIESLRERLPDYAKDLRVNLGSLPEIRSLNEQQLWGTMLAAAFASRGGTTLRAIAEEARGHLSDAAFRAAKTAGALMAMNNVYYRFLHLVSDEGYGKLPARLRMQALASPGVDKADFELWSLAVSAIHGCGRCIDGHERQIVKAGIPEEAVQDAVRAAAIVHAVAVTLEAEESLETTTSF